MKIKYTNDSELCHWEVSGQRSGNPYRQDAGNKGRFGRAPYDPYDWRTDVHRNNRYTENVTFRRRYDENTGARIPVGPDGMHEPIGTIQRYTEAGASRLAYEQSVNNAKSRKNRLDEDAVKDAERWIRDDWSNVSTAVKAATATTATVGKLADTFSKNQKQAPRVDLSHLSDQELQAILNRERNERAYNEYFNPPKQNKGAETVKTVAEVLTVAGGVASTALEIAGAIRSFKKG